MIGLQERVVLITGASRGIGAATAKVFADAGARVILTHRDSAEGARATLESLPGTGHRVIQVCATDSAALEAAANSVTEIEGRLDVLVNNAATTKVIPHADLDALDDAFFDEVFRTNVRGVFATVRAFRSLLGADGGGAIVNISSLAAQMANGSNIAYCASKAAVDNMTKSLARVLSPDIRVISVAPGLVDTELTRGWDLSVRQRMIEQTPLGRLATTLDVANTVLAVATELTFTTGVVIPVDGGRPLG
jgi:3-oxoacyl-[acyl-carrier protein] reductase